MFSRDGVTYEFHHMGIPTDQVHPGERYSDRFGIYTSDSECQLVHIQWHRFAPDSSLDALIRSVPHAAFKVNDLERAIGSRRLLLGSYEPIAGFRVAMIEDGGMPVELIETSLGDEEIWGRARSGDQAPLYEPEEPAG